MITTQHNLAGYFTKWNAIKEDLYVSLKSKTQKSQIKLFELLLFYACHLLTLQWNLSEMSATEDIFIYYYN